MINKFVSHFFTYKIITSQLLNKLITNIEEVGEI